jgi:hypothetical protein
MKRLTLLLATLAISGCSSLTFDSLAFDRFVSVSERSGELIRDCKRPETIANQSAILLDNVNHMKAYADHRGVSPEIGKSMNTLYSMVAELNARYTSGQTPSVIYCQEKLETISKTAGAISDTIGRLY